MGWTMDVGAVAVAASTIGRRGSCSEARMVTFLLIRTCARNLFEQGCGPRAQAAKRALETAESAPVRIGVACVRVGHFPPRRQAEMTRKPLAMPMATGMREMLMDERGRKGRGPV